jgi:phosphoribosylanthranilate isomerase
LDWQINPIEFSFSTAMLVKICGTTSTRDALLAQNAGADFLGVILSHPPSPRHVEIETARAIADAGSTPVVAVTVNLSLSQLLHINEILAPHALQLHGDEAPELVEKLAARGLTVWAAIGGEDASERGSTLLAAGAEALLIDARGVGTAGEKIYGGTGRRSDWNLAREFSDSGARVILSGGLDPENVAEAIQFVNPWLVDCVSGVEEKPGVKDADKVRRFVAAARIEKE